MTRAPHGTGFAIALVISPLMWLMMWFEPVVFACVLTALLPTLFVRLAR